uniref:Uncharacterized protein n=1 Tax=Sinocyclocheilus rhinocerous TaxID=307959 RepID=A0A673IT75_9TELE
NEELTKELAVRLDSCRLQCSICLDVFTDPVTTPCGHNFCRTCLNKCWTNTQTCFCPLCKEKFSRRPDPKINTTLREVVQHFKEKFNLGRFEVLCDICDGRKQKAVKSCLTCQSSYCETHLEPHHRVSRLKKHTLINAVENLEDYICQKHERPLELFLDVTLDPDTAHPKLILSDDGKQVSHGDIVHDVPENPKRFDKTISVLAKQGFSSGRFYYEVQVKGKTGWNLGVARESINRKEKITLNPENGFWAVFLRNENQYKACESSPVSFSLRVKPEIVGVFVDYEEGLVSFYYVGSSSHIYSFTVLMKYCISQCNALNFPFIFQSDQP